jgi:hypothetical protein
MVIPCACGLFLYVLRNTNTIPLVDHYPSYSHVEQVLTPSQRYCLVDEQPIIVRVMRNPSLASLYDLSILSRVINKDTWVIGVVI